VRLWGCWLRGSATTFTEPFCSTPVRALYSCWSLNIIVPICEIEASGKQIFPRRKRILSPQCFRKSIERDLQKSTAIALNADNRSPEITTLALPSQGLMTAPTGTYKYEITAGICAWRSGGRTQCPLWVISGHSVRSRPCPLYPRMRTLVERVGMSALCHKQTSGNDRLLRFRSRFFDQ
jgi:hypothetical protein